MQSLTRSDLRDAQLQMISFMERVPKAGIFAEIGLGKTGAVITYVSDLFDRFEVGNALVIAPLNVARFTWPHELKLWTQAKYLTHEVLWRALPGTATPTANGERRLRYWRHKILRLEAAIGEDDGLGTLQETVELNRLKQELKAARRTLKWGLCAAQRPADVHIINRENAVWLVHFWGKYWPYDVVIYDESSDLKNGKKVLRWRAMQKVMGATKKFIALTGTPAPNGLLNLWGQIYILDGGDRLGRTITQYREQYFTSDYNGYVYTARPEAMAAVTTAIADVCISLEAKDFMDLPPTIHTSIPVTLSDSEMDQYKQLEHDFLITLEDGGQIEAVTEGVLQIKLLQLANGLVYDAERFVHRFHSRKVEALKDYISEQQGHNVLVAYYFKHDRDALCAAFPAARLFGKDPHLIDEWNAGTVPLMFVHPGSAGHGLNIQFGGRRIIWFGPIPSRDLELRDQLNGRLAGARAVGQGTTFIDTLMCVGTIDEIVMESLDFKAMTQNLLRGALKRLNSTNS